MMMLSDGLLLGQMLDSFSILFYIHIKSHEIKHMTDIPLLPYQAFDWRRIAGIPICDDGEPLCMLRPAARLRVRPVYAEMGINGAVDAVWLRQSVAGKLHRALAHLPPEYGLEVLDGWRPLAVQAALRESFRANIVAHHPDFTEAQIQAALDDFVADPYRTAMPPPHSTGGSVDAALFACSDGLLSDMGTDFDQADERSFTAAFENETGHPARLHRRLLVNAMAAAGFTNLPSEWWHFDFGNQNWAYFSGAPYAVYGGIEP